MAAKKVLIVDDSLTMRALFTNALEKSKDLVVVGAADGADEARELIAELRPDVITLDVEMPGMNGLEFLEEIMTTHPRPVVMLSTLTQKGADVTMRAIELGAVDCFPKPTKATPAEFDAISGKLCKVVLTAAKTNLSVRTSVPKAAPKAASGEYAWDGSLVAISGGVGGIEAAMEMLSAYPANCPPTILLLQVEEGFGVPLASKLAKTIAPKVKLADDGAPLEPGTVYVTVDPSQHVVVDRWPGGCLRRIDRDPVNGCRPSADLLFASAAKVAKGHCTGVILSGDGSDGAAGLGAIKAAGGKTFAQTADTALLRDVIDVAQAKGVIDALAGAGELGHMVLGSSGEQLAA
ncbi:MAG: chemotaxis protein CheB [Blastomonas sp.]